MIPVIAQIDQVAGVRAAAVSPRQAAEGAQSAQAGRNASRPVETRRPAPVADGHGLRLTVDSHTHEVLATLVNTETNEVIRTIPGEETRRAGEVIRAIAGQLLDKLA